MPYVSSGSSVRIEQTTGNGGDEIILGYFDRDVQPPDPTNDAKRYPSHGAGNKFAKGQYGRQTLTGTLPFAITSGQAFYYLLANQNDTDSYSVTGAGPYTHTITPTKLPTTEPFDLLVGLCGDGTSPDWLRTYTDCAFYNGSITCSTDDPLRMETQIGATGVTSSGTLDDGTVATTEPFMFYMVDSNVTILGETITKLEDFTISWDNKTKPKWYFNNSGTRSPTELLRGLGDLSFSGTMTPDGDDAATDTNAIYSLLDPAATEATLNISFTLARTAGSDEIQFDFTNCVLESAPAPLRESGDEVMHSFSIMPETWTVTVIDSVASYTNPAGN